jgi:hypothetical protein
MIKTVADSKFKSTLQYLACQNLLSKNSVHCRKIFEKQAANTLNLIKSGNQSL